MRYVLAVPYLALVIIVFNMLGYSGAWMDAESLFYDAMLPSTAEFFLKVGDFFLMAGLAALLIKIVKATAFGPPTFADHMFSTATFLVALVEFFVVPFCGTATFLLLTLMALTDVVAGFGGAVLAARRNLALDRKR